MVINSLENGCGPITLLPNRSASWSQTKLFILLAGGLTLVIAVAWAVVGLWVVLPFAGLEIALLTGLMYKVSRATYQQQVIVLETDRVILESGVRFPKQRWVFTRAEAFMTLVDAGHPMGTATVSLSDSITDIEVGNFLNQQDKKKLLGLLRTTGLSVRRREGNTAMQLHV
jgi:uncharacterized membrane protein